MKEILLLVIMFWNVENFFDPFNDPLTDDDAFTPGGEKHWTWKKFVQKRDLLAKIILLAGEEYGRFPALIGMAEVENRFVLNQLVHQTPLARLEYKIIHRDSPDRRGIDVSLLYRYKEFRPVRVNFYPLKQGDSMAATRSVLYVKGIYKEMDTLHIFVNHWPSKTGGKKVSLAGRMSVSSLVKEKTDSILHTFSRAAIVLMGDFNDGPLSGPVKNLSRFENLCVRLADKRNFPSTGVKGSYKYKGKWEMLDQFLVSCALAPTSRFIRGIFCKQESVRIFANRFLLEPDPDFAGVKIKRTFVGPRFTGGASDHLPVILKIYGYDF